MVCVLKGRLLKNLLVFLRKIEDLTFFLSTPSKQREKGKNLPFGPRLTSSAKIEHVVVYFAKKGCKIEVGFADIFRVGGCHLGWPEVSSMHHCIKIRTPLRKMYGYELMCRLSDNYRLVQ